MSSAATSTSFSVERLGVIMAPEPGNEWEVEGVLNPAGTTGPDGHYYLFPRLVAPGNYSRIGIARVRRDTRGRPTGVERLGTALEPSEPYEIARPGAGGCEDPRVTYLACGDVYVMVYAAHGLLGPRVALAMSRDLRTWTRRGLADFAPERGADFNAYANKDAMLLPEPVRGPNDELCIAMLHRPMFETRLRSADPAGVRAGRPRGVDDDRPAVWISYCALNELGWLDTAKPARFAYHHMLAAPEQAWEEYRIGGGTVPLHTPEGWLTFYHGVEFSPERGRCYRTGAMLLDLDDPRAVLARTTEPIFGPDTPEERHGVISNVVFPTAVDQQADGVLDIYYGMADCRIGAARLTPRAAAAEEFAA